MQLLLFSALSLVIFLAAISGVAGSKIDHSPAASDAKIVVDQYRMFIFVADQYMRTQSSAPGPVTSIPWTTMVQSPVAPPGAKTLQMPSGWRVVKGADGSWVACTEMDEKPIGAINQLLPLPSSDGTGTSTRQLTAVELSNAGVTSTFVFIGTPTSALSAASLCNS